MIWIDKQSVLESELEQVESQKVIAVDTEADSFHSYFDKVCLIQLTANGRDMLIDPLAGEIDVSRLGRILEDRSIRKILHGADYDLRILGRDFNIRLQNLVDTMICAQLLGEPAIGLAALLQKYFGVELDKVHQRADWSRRPLPEPMRNYAAKDTKYLVDLAANLQKQLEEKGRWAWALEEFERLEEVRWTPSEDDGEGWRKLKGSGRLDPRSMEVLRRLHEWRDREARSRDVPTFRVISNDALMTIAKEKPRRRADLGAIKGVSPGLLRRYGSQLLEGVHLAMSTEDSDLPERQKAQPWKRDRRTEKMVERLKKARNAISADLGIDVSVLAPKHLLTSVAESNARTIEDLESIPAFRKWQIEVAGKAFLEILDSRGE